MDCGKEKNWYFLTLLKPKTPCGKRPNRVTGLNEGVWTATGCPIPIMDDDDDDQNITLGHKRSFCYYQKKPKKDKTNYQTKPKKEYKTNWIMHEYTIGDKINWILYKIHHHSSGSESSQEAEGVGDAAPEQFNTDDARYCLSTSQEPITALVPYSCDSRVCSSTNTMIDMEVDGIASYCLSTSQEPIAAMVPYSYDSQVYSSTNTMIDMENDGNIQSVNNLCSLSGPSTPFVAPNTMIDMQFDDGNMQSVNNLW
ncbi:hypothetical protein MRB53_007046 [Persea americana]|uniref:Uncharacterized protein n=1 Tax=Persea americana TaxID=3435 RepID=A0ACC2MIV0_PERAE|nr:hypothetical protein MRB53_007046 [Persea americana]